MSRSSNVAFARRPPSPESPQPYIPYDKRSTSLFPVTSGDPPPLRADELPDYIREFNRTHSCKLHIWTRIRGATQLSNPAVVRFTIRDVLVGYVTMAYILDDPVLVTESVTVFGPREKVCGVQNSQDPFFYGHFRNPPIPSPIFLCIKVFRSKLLGCFSRIPVFPSKA
jgi:hypothetical protein